MTSQAHERQRILILGAGFAALETAFLLRMRAHDALSIGIVAPDDRFVFRPASIYVPFGTDPDSLLVDLHKPFAKRDIDFHEDSAVDIDTDSRLVHLRSGARLQYDKLVVATGADMRPEEIPGLAEHAATVWTARAMLDLRRRFERLREDAHAGHRRRVLFLIPPNNKCAGPLYEIVFMLETWLRREHVRDRVEIELSSFERGFIQAFGPRLHEVVSGEFAERGIRGHLGENAVEVTADSVTYADGSTREYDLLVAFPPYVAATRFESLPTDERGFIATAHGTRQVVGHPDVYAPGDAGDFPVKQAFLAFLQADAVAEHIAATVAAGGEPADFDPVSRCIMEMLDTATFAQVPLEVTGDPAQPVRVRPGAEGDYRVGVSPVWRLGKKVLGRSVPMRFSAGDPFHAGAGWQVMDAGLRGMKGVLARH